MVALVSLASASLAGADMVCLSGQCQVMPTGSSMKDCMGFLLMELVVWTVGVVLGSVLG